MFEGLYIIWTSVYVLPDRLPTSQSKRFVNALSILAIFEARIIIPLYKLQSVSVMVSISGVMGKCHPQCYQEVARCRCCQTSAARSSRKISKSFHLPRTKNFFLKVYYQYLLTLTVLEIKHPRKCVLTGHSLSW